MATNSKPKRVTIPSLVKRKRIASNGSREKIVCLTAYDYTFARLIDQAGIDIILVGDSLGSVIQGHETTIPVSLDEVIYHAKCVRRGAQHALIVGDLPFLSYQVSPEQAIESAGRMLKEAQVAAVKLEGGAAMADTIGRLTAVDIPVMGHVGLTPQSYHRMGGYKIQGRTNGHHPFGMTSAEQILEDALAVEKAGAFAIVLEGLPDEIASVITARLSIPTIGIGAGAACDGQILVTHDLLGMDEHFSPSFVKKYAELAQLMQDAFGRYRDEVRQGTFPSDEHTFHLSPEETPLPALQKVAKVEEALP